MSPVQKALEKIHALMKEGMSLEAAAAAFKRRNPSLYVDVMDEIGLWPSSEPELAAIQRLAP